MKYLVNGVLLIIYWVITLILVVTLIGLFVVSETEWLDIGGYLVNNLK